MSDPSGTDPSRDPAASTPGERRESDAPARGNETGAWQAPWVASPEHPEGAAAAPVPPQQATGHYGAGYDDPTPHFGNTLPGRPEVDAPGEGADRGTTESGSTARRADGESQRAGTAERSAASPDETRAARSEEAIRERDAPAGAHHPTEDPDRSPDFTPQEVNFRPPDRAPSEEAPASENAGLIFERS